MASWMLDSWIVAGSARKLLENRQSWFSAQENLSFHGARFTILQNHHLVYLIKTRGKGQCSWGVTRHRSALGPRTASGPSPAVWPEAWDPLPDADLCRRSEGFHGLQERVSPAWIIHSNDDQVGEVSSSESCVGSVPDSVERPSAPGPGLQVTGWTAEGLPLFCQCSFSASCCFFCCSNFFNVNVNCLLPTVVSDTPNVPFFAWSFNRSSRVLFITIPSFVKCLFKILAQCSLFHLSFSSWPVRVLYNALDPSLCRLQVPQLHSPTW